MKPWAWPPFWPQHLRNTRGLYALAVLVMGLVGTALSLVNTPEVPGRAVRQTFAVVLALMTWHYWRGMTLDRLVMWGAVLGLSYLCGISLYEGGVHSSTLAWLPLLPLCVFYILPPRLGRWRWVALTLLAQALMAGLTWLWADQLPLPSAEDLPSLSLADYVLASLALFLVPSFYQREFDHRVQELQGRQSQLLQHQQALEHTVRMREHFIASVSHELRTPMNAILGLNALLLEQVHDRPQARRVLEYTRQSADHLMTVINDVLDFAQLSSGALRARPEPTELAATVHAAFELFRPQVQNTALDYRCQIEPDVPHWVLIDRHRLMQVLVNLLGNALKFTPQGQVLLSVGTQAQGVRFEVRDTGIGMTEAQQQAVFERYQQAHARIGAQYGGSGLGLTISQRLVQMLGGQLQVDSQPGQGSCFGFTLPLMAVAAPPGRDPAALAPAGPDPRPWRFLVADDHPVNRLLVRRALRLRWPACAVTETEDGARALAALAAQGPFDLVFMDMVMPVCDGIEAVRQMRASADPVLAQTPVLGLTANVNPQDLERFEQAGLQGLLLKPFDLQQLYAEVERVVDAARARPN